MAFPPTALAQQIHPHFLNLIDSQSSKLEPHNNTSRAVIIAAQPRSTRAEFFRHPTYNPTEASSYETRTEPIPLSTKFIHKLPRPACQGTLHVRPPYEPRTLFKTYPFSGRRLSFSYTQFWKISSCNMVRRWPRVVFGDDKEHIVSAIGRTRYSLHTAKTCA